VAGGQALPFLSFAREARGCRAGMKSGDEAAVEVVGRNQGSLIGLWTVE
jgi:hypothetical protein